MKVNNFKREAQGFECYFEYELKPYEILYLKMPNISATKRSVNDIGWQSENKVTLYATLANNITRNPEKVLWNKIENEQDINKTVQFLKVVAGGEGGILYIRVNLN